ncbi:MAG: hypothetical protein ABSD68_01590 [Candidatus Micrarchaeales archaeon]|jgi:hypothetical protein
MRDEESKEQSYSAVPNPFTSTGKFIGRVRSVAREKGIVHLAYWSLWIASQYVVNPPVFLYYKLFTHRDSFQFMGNSYDYLCRFYNSTWKSQRAIEVPIGYRLLKQYEGKRILEFGNVMEHYFPSSHEVLDKYEKADGVINEDVVSFNPGKEYDLILSISTLEHVGWDEIPKEEGKIPKAVENLKGLLAKEGLLFMTMDVGYNQELDSLLAGDALGFDEIYYMKRTSRDNKWMQVNKEEMGNSQGVAIGIIKK